MALIPNLFTIQPNLSPVKYLGSEHGAGIYVLPRNAVMTMRAKVKALEALAAGQHSPVAQY